ncbi:polycystin-1 isoform X2 [Amphiprion ocellaris]|uniref:polycystin-1 isoform X2 n=1 Tax=Amphiprion ocellaris TaxID=80972 RepID=UPI002411256E|nr:polycystin-1 isoform X2 [Amphiprion ocellaris]
MTARLVSQKQVLLCILSVVVIITAEENIPCPKGGHIHLASLRCYWLSEMTSSWFEAQDSCKETPGGNLASADSQELQSFIFYSFPVKTTVWVWIQRLEGERPEQDGVVEPQRWDRGSQKVCSQMALGTLGRWRKAQCAGRYLFLCKKEISDSLPSMDSYLTGLVLLTGVYADNKIQALSGVPDIGQRTVEMQLFPGLWFSHAGHLASVELVVQPSAVSSVARIQILRPYCNPNHHLVPPGCSSLLNPFSCCSAVPLCNTTGGCSMGQYWCHLLEACVPTTSSCSPYDAAVVGRGFTLPPRYPALPPFYHLVADFPLRINPSSELKTLSLLLPSSIMVYPDDIVAVQHTLDSGAFLHCLNGEATFNSPWRQSYLSIRGTEWGGWLEGGLTSLPQGSKWVDGVVCDLRMLYVDTIHRATEHDDIFDYTHTETTTVPDTRSPTGGPNPSVRSKFRLNVIHPLPDDKNQIHVQINIPTLIIVKALFGEKAKSSWSAPVLQTGVPFLPSCPEEVVQSSPGCKKQSQDVWFSSVTLLLPSAGVQMLNISVMDVESFQSVRVKVCGYEKVAGLTVEPHGCLRMLVDTSQSFTAKVESGSSVKFTWVIDNLEKFANEGESYSVMFKKPAEYKLRVTASNPVSSQNQQILLTADEKAPLAEPEFLSVGEVVAVDAAHVYTIRVKVDISLPVTFRWDFGDGGDTVIHTQSAPCQTMEENVKRGESQVYVQDSVNYAYPIPGNYTLHVHISNQFDNANASMKINVCPLLKSLLISTSTLMPLVKQTVHLEASIQPSDFTVFYTWNYSDGAKAVQNNHRKVSHSFGSAGVYNITVCASNTLSSLTAWLVVVVMEKISGLTVTYSGPSEVGSATHFKAKAATGTGLKWDFDFGDGSLQENLTDGSVSHIYKFPSNYTVDVTVSNSVSQAHQSITVEVYSLIINGIFPTECVMSGKNTQFAAVVNGNISSLTFHWLFGEDSFLTVVTGRSTAMHTFSNYGIFHVNLTVFSSITSVAFSTVICVESPITNIELQSSKDVVAIGEEVCFRVLVSPEQMTGYQFMWLSKSSGLAAVTEHSQKCLVFKDEGVEEVSVMVRNKVSTKTAKADITIQKPVSKCSVVHGGQSDTLTVNTLASFWVLSCTGSNVSVLWDFGDGSPVEQKHNISHVFTSAGQFTVTATAFNAVSQDSATVKVNVLLPVSDLSLQTNHPYAAVGEETLITAVCSSLSNTTYYWTVESITSTKQGTYQFRFIFPKPGVYQVKVIAQNLVSRMEAAILIEVFERIDGLQIECQNLTNKKYVSTFKDLPFIAAVTKGSNVTYHWLVTQSNVNRQITGEGKLFHVLAESPGSISVQLKASNILGEVHSSISVVAVERVRSAHIATLSNIVALGKLVNISVFVDIGSDLQYFWYVNTNLSPMQTHVPFLLHTFTSLGQCFVTVSVKNFVSQSNDTKQFLVQEEVQGLDFQINSRKHSFYVNASAALSFHGIIHKGSDLHWDWTVGTAKQNLFTSTSQTFIYRFPHAGIHQVYLNVSNRISWQMVSHSVTVQESIKGLLLNISKSSLCFGEQVVIFPSISKGSNVSFEITFQNKDWIHRQNISKGHFSTSSLPVGKHLVTVQALNQVSSAETSSSIIVSEPIQGLRLVNCCFTTLEALKGIQLKAEVQSGFPVDYSWMFHLGSSELVKLMGQEVTFTPPESGSLSVSVLASHGVCTETINDTLTVEWPVKKIRVSCHSEKIFVGHAVRFSATVKEGNNVRYLWDFGDSSEVLVTDSKAVNHTYYSTGKYSVVVKALNDVSHVSTQLHMEVEELQCSNPQASLLQSESTIFKSRPSFFEASVDINCSAYKTKYLWEIFRESNGTKGNPGNTIALKNQEDTTSPFLLLPKHALNVGHYFLVFTVSFHGTPLLIQRKTSITVVHSPLVAIIKGGSHRLWPSLSDLVLDGSECHDPDIESGVEDALQYHWAWMTANSTESPFGKQPTGSISSRMTVLSSQLHSDTVYIFTLTVHKKGRRPVSVNQTVTVTETPVLPVTVQCVSCSVQSHATQISYNTPIVLVGQCEQCDGQAQYKWSAQDQSGLTLDLDEVNTSAGRYSPKLVVRSGVLQPGQSYSFALDVSQPGNGHLGSASQMIRSNSSPHGGQCDLSPESDIQLLETVVTYSCSGWRQPDESMTSQLIYTFQVASCQPISTVCPLLTIYRGTRSTFSSLVPMGSPGQQKNMSVITLILLVEDHLGAKVLALNRTLTVENHKSGEVASQWLRIKSQTELWALVQHGNPQEIVPYSIALTSKLNQMESKWTAEELMDRREIRENVTKALTSLPVSSLLDVDQISSALSQSTAVPSELICERCHEKVLEAVGKMIHVIEEQMSPAVLPAVDTGRNILNVIGSTLAAVSESVSASSSHPAYSSSLQAASVIALSALSHAGALMRTLMHSRVHEEAPLSLDTNYIHTVGFQGDPSDLLCTHQLGWSSQHLITSSQSSSPNGDESSHPCQFYIPTSLTAHLKSQRSDVVQVLFDVHGALESNPLLTAANPPISTALVAMELTTPQGEPVSIQDLDPEQAIRVTLPNKYPVEQGDGGDGREGDIGNGTCLIVTLPTEGRLNFTVKALDDLDENAGLYISFNFSLAPVSVGHVKTEVSSAVPGTNASRDSLVREWDLPLSGLAGSSEETIFLSPLLNGTDQPLSVNLTSSLVDGGPVRVSVCVFSSLCQYYSVKERRWSSDGLQPLEGSTLHTAHCLTQHLTMFGASLFVHPGAVVLLPPSGGPMRNMVVGIVCAVLVLIHLLVGLIAHKLDHLDSLRLSQVPLCGRPGLYHYRVLVKTGWRPGAGTTAHVGISLYGVNKSGSRHLQRDGAFQRGSLNQFHMETDNNLGEVWKIRIWHDNTGLDPSWYVQHVVVWDPQTDHMFFFLVEDWLSVENQKNGTVEKEVLASCPEELTQFGRVLTSQLMFGMVERHLWLSLWQRPAHGSFTRGQRVTCSALLLHLYLALGALWYGAVSTEGHSGPVSSHLLVNIETVAVGMTVAMLVFPLQCFLCFLFRKAHCQVTVDMSAPPSPVCHSVEMDVYLGQSELSGPSFLSLPDSSGPVRDSHSSLLESKVLNSSILDFWAASGLAPQTDGAYQEEGVVAWPSCDSLLNLPAGSRPTKTTLSPSLCKSSPLQGPTRQLRRKKALMQLHLSSPISPVSPTTLFSSSCTFSHTEDISSSRIFSAEPGRKSLNLNPTPVQLYNHNLTTLLTLSEEDLLMSIAAAEDTADATNGNSDSGRDSSRTTSSFSTICSTSCSSWSEQSEDKSLYGAEIGKPELQSYPSLCGAGLYKCPSVISVDSVASTFLPSPSPDSTRSSSTTRIGVARGQPSRLLPPWALCVIYPLVAVLLGACLAVVGLYGSFFSRRVVLMWLVSALSAFLTSALLLEPLKVCAQALIYTVAWRPVDPEVEEQLAQETTVVRAFGEHSGKVQPPCGYGLLQAKEEARKVRALRSLMMHCVCQLLFLLLVLMVNYQDRMEQSQGRLLHSAVRRRLHTAPLGFPNLTSLRDWSDAEQWISHTLVPHLHQNPTLLLVGLPQLQYTDTQSSPAVNLLGNNSVTTHQLLADTWRMAGTSKEQLKTLSIDFTHYHRESGLFMIVSIQLAWARAQGVTPFLFIHPLLIPSSVSGPDLQVALTVLLLLSALIIFFGELWSMATERAQYLFPFHHWFQLLLAFLSLTTAMVQLCFLSLASSCVSKLRSHPDSFIHFHTAALLAQTSSQCAAVLLTLLVLKLLGTLRFVRRWVVIGRVLQRAWRELWALTVLVLLLLLLCTHLGNTLFSRSVEGFVSIHQAGVSLLSILRGHMVLQRLCKVHPVLGPLYGLLLMGGGVWLMARLCGAVLIRAYRAEQAELFHPAIEPQDYEMVEFFIKRLKLWMGLTKAKQFRHRVKFEDMEIPPSRSSQESHLSTLSSTLPSSHSPSLFSLFSSPCPLSSALSIRSEDSLVSNPGSEVQPYLDNLLPCVNALLSRFDRVNQITEDIHNLEIKLEEVQARRRKAWIKNKKENEGIFGELGKPKEPDERRIMGEVRHRKIGLLYPRPRVSLPSSFSFTPSTFQPSFAPTCIFPHTRNSYSESESVSLQSQPFSEARSSEAAKLALGNFGLCAGSPGFGRFPRRRAWYSGSSHSADATQRFLQLQGVVLCRNGGENVAFANARPRSEEGVRRQISDGVPVKRKAWISEGPETD